MRDAKHRGGTHTGPVKRDQYEECRLEFLHRLSANESLTTGGFEWLT